MSRDLLTVDQLRCYRDDGFFLIVDRFRMKPRCESGPRRAARPGSTGRRPGRTRKEVSGHSEEEERRQEEGGKDEEGEKIDSLSLNWLARGDAVTPLLLSAAPRLARRL